MTTKFFTPLSLKYLDNLVPFAGYTYAGVQLGYICLCGNSFGRHGHVPESRCQTKCNGDRAQKCGGAWANAVYKVSNQGNIVTL